ncbi:MAG: adenylate/guanylate cyclase domain-containing protein [Candidatus Cloacimonadota bacterium]|nr:adenylate/guanylate cyclase domain-containing protein [Candidatus Cloacimonadota bacterium]
MKKTNFPKARLTKNYKKWYIGFFLAIVISLIVSFLQESEFGKQLELKTLDYRFRKFTCPAKADTNIVLVSIDDSSLDYFSSFGIYWKWPRSYYGFLVDYLSKVEAKAVIFDMMFDDPDINRDETDAEETDGAFAQAIKNYGKTILAGKFSRDSLRMMPNINRFALNFQSSSNKYLHPNNVGGSFPIDTLLNATNLIGIIDIQADNDGIIRRAPLISKYQNKYYPQLAFACLLQKENERTNIIQTHKSISFENNTIPVDKSGKYLINWYGSGGPDGFFQYIPFAAVIQSASALEQDLEPTISHNKFKNKYVIIGATASGLSDLRTTPFVKPYPGFEIWATILSNFINRDFVTVVPFWLNLLNTIFAAFLTFLIFTRFKPRISNPLMIALLIYILGLSLWLWSGQRILLNITMPLFGFFIMYFAIVTVSFLMEGQSKREIRKVFTRYLHPDVIKSLLEHPNEVEIGGNKIEATVLFTDIANFTTFSEGHTPTELVKLLNEYFEKLTQIVIDNNGLLDKYTGDGLMAIFGAPVQREDHAVLACKVALAHRTYCRKLLSNPQIEESSVYNFHIHTRIGINSGEIVAGNIGSKLRMDYTAIGDGVNLSARLEGVNKVYKTNVIISQSTYDLISGSFICRELDTLRVKGKKKPTKIYELVAENHEATAELSELIEKYTEALGFYRTGKWEKAIEIFKKLTEGSFSDPPSQIMLKRCIDFKKKPPKNWDGVLTMEVK